MKNLWREGLSPAGLGPGMAVFGASGEGMPQDHRGDRRASGVLPIRATLSRIVLAAALAGFVAGGGISVVRAADDGSNDDTAIAKLLQKLGLKAPPDQSADITYSERSPLVVPPTRDLPPPAADAPPGADWPKDAGTPRKHVKSKSPPPAPATAAPVAPAAPASPAAADGGTATGQSGQAPQGGQATQPAPAQTGSVARVPNPTPQPTSWWNPKTWFNHEEYANFATEPPREDLTDPPAGYRTPSPDQPYGVGPEHKGKTDTPNAQTGGGFTR